MFKKRGIYFYHLITGILICLYSIGVQNFCVAQEVAPKKLDVAFIYTSLDVTDQAMSALEYSGNYLGASANYEVSSSKGLQQNLRLGFGAGRLHNRDYETSLSGKSFSFGYSVLPVMYRHKNLRLLAGGVLDNYLAVRNHEQYINNNNYYEFTGSLTLAAKVVYQTGETLAGKKRGYIIQSAFLCPVLTALSRSASVYNAVSDVQSPTFSTYIKNINLVSFNRYRKFGWHTEISRQLFKNTGFALSYQWDYYRIIEPNEVQSISHTVALKYFWYL